MSLLNRPDGVQFVVQPYRERIAISKRSVMVQRLRLLSEQHGQYVSLFPLGQGAIEAIFSKESGYLLGESLWTYLDKPAYLIFCERMSKENSQVLLVIVRANEIYLDAVIDNDKLRSELLPLMTLQESYRVITCGDVSLSLDEAPGHFVLPKHLVGSFEMAQESILKRLPVLPTARLLTLLLALRSPLLGSKISPALMATGVATLLAVVWWIYAMSPSTENVPVQKIVAEEPDVAYVDFYAAMQTPAPEQQLNELAKTVVGFYALPGWQPDTILYNGSQYQIQLDRQGGALQWLADWTAAQHYSLNLGSNGAEITVQSQLARRSTPKVLYPLSAVVVSLIDQLDRLFPNRSVSIGDPKMLGQTQSRTITINFADASPDTLTLIGNALGSDLPLSISAMNFSVRSGLLNGNVQLSVWGI